MVEYDDSESSMTDPDEFGTLELTKQKKAELETSPEDEYEGIDYTDHSIILNLLTDAQEADHDNREAAREAHLFVDKRDGQWEPYWWSNNAAKPRYTFDMVNPIIDQIAGEIQNADFDIKVSPAGGVANKKTAITLDGIIRNIENISNASHVYGSSARSMITAGLDGWRVSTKYVDDNSFDQDLIIESISNYVDRVWFDPAADKADKSDARYGFVLHPTAVSEYEARFPDRGGLSVSDDRAGSAYYDKADTIVIGEFLYIKTEPRELVLMSSGQVYEINDDYKAMQDDLAQLGITEVRRRIRQDRKVCSRLFDGDGWLEEHNETVFSTLPIIPLYGNFKINENKTIYWGAVEKLLDPQRVLNYSLSREIEEGALAPRAKYWMTLTQASGHEDSIRTLNTNSDPVQFYNVDPQYPQVPQQQGGAQVNPGLRTISESMRGMITMSAGMFAASMGDNPGAQSGVAIEALQNKGDNGTYKYFKSLEIAIAYTGKVLLDAIPKVYDTSRIVRILREDGSFEMSEINQEVIDQQTGKIKVLNDLSVGTYDVICRAGPSYKNRQQETLQTIINMAKVDPSIMEIAGDIMLQNINTPAADMIAERKRAQMVAAGMIPASQLTDEEKAEAEQRAQAQGQQQPQDPAALIAQAELLKAQALMTEAQTDAQRAQMEMMKLQASMQTDQSKLALSAGTNQIRAFDSETKRMDTEIKAQQAGANVNLNASRTEGQAIDNQIKINDMQAMANPFSNLSDEELMLIARGGQ
jgi:hypothetical protein